MIFTNCQQFNPEEKHSKAVVPFKEYKVIEKEVFDYLEKGILEIEASSRSLDIIKPAAHVINLNKIVNYASGDIGIIGISTPEKIELRKN